MKTLFTLTALCLVLSAGAQFNKLHSINNHNYLDKRYFTPHTGNQLLRGASACDSFDLMDYCTYNEVWALDNGQASTAYYGFNSGGNPLYVQALSSFVDSASASSGYYNYAAMVFDSLALQDYPSQSLYGYPLAQSTITIEGIEFFYAFDADTVAADGKIAHDSLVFSVYAVDHGVVGSTPVAVQVTGGDTLASLYTGTTSVGVGSVPVQYTFNQGEGFFIKVQYLNKDTSTKFSVAFTFLDSCGLVTYQGGQYMLADPSPLPSAQYQGNYGLSFSGVIMYSSGSASVQTWSNLSGLNAGGIPANCQDIPNQNYCLLPIIDICENYGAQITASPNQVCNSNTINLSASVYGSASTITVITPNTLTEGGAAITDSLHWGNFNNSNLTYTWSASSGTLSSSVSPTPSLAASGSSTTTVTLNISDGVSVVTDSIVLIGCQLQASLGNNQTVCTGSNIILAPTVTGGTPPYSYQWQSTGSALNCQTCANPGVTLSQNSTYTLTVTDAANSTATASVSWNITATTNTMQVSAASTVLGCYSGLDTATVTISGGTSPYTVFWGNGASTSGGSPQTYNYTQAGVNVIGVTDAAGCVSDVFDTVLSLAPTATVTTVVQPGCPGSNSGEIAISVTGGTPPYSVNWSTGSTGDTLLNVPSGIYTAAVTDAHGCPGSVSYTLEPVHDPDYYVYLNAGTANCNTPGNITSLVTGGTPPYSFAWSNSATTQNIQSLTAGNYFVTVTDSLGCSVSGSAYLSTTCASYITGIVFIDSLGNCTYNPSDPVEAGVTVSAQSSNADYFYGTSDGNGNYSIAVYDTGTFTLLFDPWYYSNICGNVTFCNNPGQTVYLPVLGDTSANNNIGISVSTNGFNLGVHPGWTSANPGFTKEYWAYYYNSSPVPFTGQATVIFIYDPSLTYTGTDETPAPVNDALNHTLTWNVDSVPGFDMWYQVDAYFMVPDTLSLNYLLQSDFTIEPLAGDCDTSDNHLHFSEVVTGSHDPNEKIVQPAGPISDADSILTYTIWFQNNGTDSTHFVVVKDTLSSNLDAGTVRNIASSDKYSSFAITGQGILTWTFNPLRIVDSATNPSGSKRFIMFSVKRKTNLPVGSTINNTAAIYFDYNTPVYTNTVGDTFGVLAINPVSPLNGIRVSAYPNPFDDFTNISISGISDKYAFELYDVTGRLQRTMVLEGDSQFKLNRADLAAGIYTCRVIIAGHEAAYGKLVID